MGWAARSALTSEAVRPPEHQDVLFFDDAPQSMATVPEGHLPYFSRTMRTCHSSEKAASIR